MKPTQTKALTLVGADGALVCLVALVGADGASQALHP